MMTQIDTKTIAARVTPALHRTVRVRAAEHGMNMSDAVVAGLELWLARVTEYTKCPMSDGPTVPHPDPLMSGARYCEACNEAVLFVES